MKKLGIKKAGLLGFLGLLPLLSSCYMKNIAPQQILVYDSDEFKYEIQIGFAVKGRGNIHTFSLSKYEFEDFDWIYTNSILGHLDADSIIFTYHQRRASSPWNQMKESNLKGSVEFKGDSAISIDLYFPYYKDGISVDHWEPYRFNGTYRMKLLKQHSPLIENH